MAISHFLFPYHPYRRPLSICALDPTKYYYVTIYKNIGNYNVFYCFSSSYFIYSMDKKLFTEKQDKLSLCDKNIANHPSWQYLIRADYKDCDFSKS